MAILEDVFVVGALTWFVGALSMTVLNYGRVTPLQSLLLGLGGEVVHLPMSKPTDEQRIGEMKASKDLLCKLTGCDFGFDLALWHHNLLASEKHKEQYTFPYAWKAVQRRILELLGDPTRLRLAQLLQAESDQQLAK
jgi:hypothetical protein